MDSLPTGRESRQAAALLVAGFWEEHAEREAERERVEHEAKFGHYAQDRAETCAHCGETSPDVLLGICGSCFKGHLDSRHEAVQARQVRTPRYY